MPGTVHALLVGIDAYPDPVHRLEGCRNDVDGLSEFLRLRVPAGQLRLRVLHDAEATREAVIDAFGSHLGQAGPDDTALFYFAGHGSREHAPPAFWTIEPDRLNQTLVMFDSRGPGGWDLADKELAVLLRALAARGPRIVVMLDACHSGSGTRQLTAGPRRKVRRFPLDARPRPLDSFLPEVQALVTASAPGASGWDLGGGARHILLAACRDDEEAEEYWDGTRAWGLFTHVLLQALAQAPGQPSYRALAALLRTQVLALGQQTPQLEATADADLDRAFLGDAIVPRAASFALQVDQGEWWMAAGSIHGVPAPVDGECTRVAVFQATADAAALARVGEALAQAELDTVQAARSRLRLLSGALVAGVAYQAVLCATPLRRHGVALDGTAAEVAAVRAALASAMWVRETVDSPDLRLDCAPGRFSFQRADGTEPTAPAASAAEAVRDLEHLARWQHFADLGNPLSRILDHEVELTVYAGKTGTDVLPLTDLRLAAQRDAQGRLQSPQFRIAVRNTGTRDLYVGLLALDELHACTSDLLVDGVRKLRPGDGPTWALDGKALQAAIPAALRAEGRTEARDLLKLIVSTQDFDIRHANLDPLRAPTLRQRAVPRPAAHMLDRLLARSQTRTISAAADDDMLADFGTRTFVVTTTEPGPGVPLGPTQPAEPVAGLRIAAHPTLRARVRLDSLAATRGEAGLPLLPPAWRSGDSGETVWFGNRRGGNGGLAVLVLDEVPDHRAVTPEQPLAITLPLDCGPADVVLPLAHDGEDYLVLGHGGRRAAGTVVLLSRLPHPVAERRRSLTGSIKILFRKFTSTVFGTDYAYPILAAARWEAGRQAQYDHDAARLRSAVQGAQRVVVFVHGIIGDTLAMGAHLPPRPGDLLLAFDYENLHTSIEENASRLQQRLADAGLGPGHGKHLVLVAHSMGGLVSRWFVEKLGGHQSVARVVLCGTPNAGSQWASIEDLVTGMASLALNGLTAMSWEATLVASLFSGLEKIDHSLDQMRPGSDFLQQLAALPDPGIPYTVIAGNTALAGAADGGRVQRVLKKVLHRTTDLAFLGAPNDMAASVASIGAVGRGWVQPPEVRVVPCDHVSYFASDAGLARLRNWLDVA